MIIHAESANARWQRLAASVACALVFSLIPYSEPKQQLAFAKNAVQEPKKKQKELTCEELVGLLESESYKTRMQALRALFDLGPKARGALPAVIKLAKTPRFGELDSPQKADRAAAIHLLIRLDFEGAEILPTIVDALKDSNPHVVGTAAAVVGELGPKKGAKAIPALVKAMDQAEGSAKSNIIQVIGTLGPAAKESAPSLRLAMKDSNAFIANYAASALWAVTGEDVVPFLKKNLDSKDPESRSVSAIALGSMGPAAASAVPLLASKIADPSKNVRASIVVALGAIGENPNEAIPALIKALKDEDSSVRGSAADSLEALGKLGMGRAAVPALLSALKDSDQSVRVHAYLALRRIDPVAAQKSGFAK